MGGWIFIASLFFLFPKVQAGNISLLKDTLSSSLPASPSIHEISFITKEIIPPGSFQIIFPVSANPNDSVADIGGFDFNSLAIEDISTQGFASNGIIINPSNGTIQILHTQGIPDNTNIKIVIGKNNFLLNPAKSQMPGNADIWPITLDQLDLSGVVEKRTRLEIGIIEAVKISAKINPRLVFTIAGVNAQENIATIATTRSTTSQNFDFENLKGNEPETAAQILHLETNAQSGYALSVFSSGPLRAENGASIPDFTPELSDNFDSYGFGFSLQNLSGNDAVFQTGNNQSKFYSRGFAQNPTTIMSNSGPVSASESYILYRVKISPSQPAASYQTDLTFIITAIF